MKKSIALTLALITSTISAFAQIGSASSDLVFTPVTPCRIFDTRTSQGGTGPIPAAGTKGFAVWGQTSFAAQGGSTSNCGLVANSNTAAVAVNLTVVLPAAGGFITAYPSGVTAPTAATVNFNAGDVKGNFAIVKVQQAGAAPNLNVYSTSLTDVVGDVVGFYSKPVATALECQVTSRTTVPIAFNDVAASTAPLCANGYTETATNCSASGYEVSFARQGDGICSAKNNGGISRDISAWRTCCRIPGR
jgi:hypothetical protein